LFDRLMKGHGGGFCWYVPLQSARITDVSTHIVRPEKVKHMRSFRYWLPVILGMVFIYWMSTGGFYSANTLRFIEPIIRFFAPSLSRKQIIMIHGVIRKLAHVTEYLILGILLFRAFRAGSQERRWWTWGLSSVAVVALYAAGDEMHQYFVSTRTASLADVGFDTLGGILAQFVSIVWYRQQRADGDP
jgi:VanZ family protein